MSILNDDFDQILNSELDIRKFSDKTILVTGATGLIGSLIIKFLIYANQKMNLNIKIFGLVRNLEKAKCIFQSIDYYGVLSFVVADLGRQQVLIDESNIDYVIHLAAVTKSKLMVMDPVNTIKTTIDGTREMLELAVEKNVSSMVYVSSMEVYGQPIVKGKTTENDLGYVDLTSVRSSYPESKRMAEMLCTAYSEEYGVNVKTARLAQTFGAGILPTENRVFAQFAKSALKHENLVLHTTGESEGNYIYTADAIKALLFLLLNGKNRQAYNVSNEDNHLTIREMAQLVIDTLGLGNEKVIIDIPKESLGYAPDVHMWLSNKKLCSLGWSPRFNLVESYQRMAIYMRENGF